MRLIEVDALKETLDRIPARSIENADGRAYVLIRLSTVLEIIKQMPSVEQEERTEEHTETHACDCISRQDAIRWVKTECNPYGKPTLDFESGKKVIEHLEQMPSAQPFHNITMDDVLKYIDRMPEDVWQEFTACLECRGWELQRRTAKWCGSEFA